MDYLSSEKFITRSISGCKIPNFSGAIFRFPPNHKNAEIHPSTKKHTSPRPNITTERRCISEG